MANKEYVAKKVILQNTDGDILIPLTETDLNAMLSDQSIAFNITSNAKTLNNENFSEAKSELLQSISQATPEELEFCIKILQSVKQLNQNNTEDK